MQHDMSELWKDYARRSQRRLCELREAIGKLGCGGILKQFVKVYLPDDARIPPGWALFTIERLCTLSVEDILKVGQSAVVFVESFASALIRRLRLLSPRANTDDEPRDSGKNDQQTRLRDLADRLNHLRRQNQEPLGPLTGLRKQRLIDLGLCGAVQATDMTVDEFLKLDKNSLKTFVGRDLERLEQYTSAIERMISFDTETGERLGITNEEAVPHSELVANLSTPSMEEQKEPHEDDRSEVREPSALTSFDNSIFEKYHGPDVLKHLREGLDEGTLDDIKNLSIRQVRGPLDVHLPAALIDQSVEWLLTQPFECLLSVSGVAPWRLVQLFETLHNSMSGSPAAEQTAAVRFQRLAKAIRDPKYNGLTPIHLSTFLRPDDKYVPRALASKPIGEILGLSFAALEQMRGIGKTKIVNLLEVLERELRLWSAKPISAINEVLLDSRADVSRLLAWEVALKRIELSGLGRETLGRLAITLRDIPHRFWAKRFQDYFGLSREDISELEGHGHGALAALFNVFIAVGQNLPEDPSCEQYSVSLSTYWIARCESLVLDLLSTAVEDIRFDDIQAIGEYLLHQIETDLDQRSAEIASTFCGFAPSSMIQKPATLSVVGTHFDLSRERIRQVMTRIEQILAIRWPSGPHLLECLAVRCVSHGNQHAADVLSDVCERLLGAECRIPSSPAQEWRNPFPVPTHTKSEGPKSESRDIKRKTLTDHVRAVLLESPQGMKLREIAALIIERGYETESRQFENVVYQALHRDPQFTLDKARRLYFHKDLAPSTQSLFPELDPGRTSPQRPVPINDLLEKFLDSDAGRQ